MSRGGQQVASIMGTLSAPLSVLSGTVRRHRPDYMIILYMGLLMLIGLVMIYAIGPQRANVLNNSYGSNYSDTYFFVKQAVSLLLSLGAFALMAVLPYTLITKHGGKLLLIGFASCALLAITGWAHLSIAQCSLGACRWFDLGGLGSLQPAEILKFGVLIFVAGFLGTKVAQRKVNDLHETLIPLAVITALAMLFIVVIEKDMGTGIALASIIVTMLIVGGISKKIGAIVVGAAVIVGIGFIIIAPHRIDRITTFFQGDNTSTTDAASYQIAHAKIAIGTGGWTGVGIGNSVQATGYLPEAINDSVFAIMGETFGFLGLVAILGLFVALLMRLLKVMDHLIDIRLKLIAAGVFGWLGAHVILNVASMIGIFPLTGITLPLLSFGGTSMIFIAAALGLIFQLSRYTVHTSRLKEATNENSSSRRGIGRPRYAGRSSS
ncbi:FtsW/RodA/SpoVE family cell cycle protein [Patescibacteria group bacterium]|nr:MAG: FtsW/RodA/SpoVE family cell cycle protein [Patescibacteria group bacterium]